MKLSDAIEAGARLLNTPGPSHLVDCYVAAQAGLAQRTPSPEEQCAFYWDNPWGIAPFSELELWLRLTVTQGYRWAEVLNKLRSYDA